METVYNLLGEHSLGKWKGGQLEEIETYETTGSYKVTIMKIKVRYIKEIPSV